MVHRVEDVRSGLVDRNSSGPGGWVGALAGVQSTGIKVVVIGFDHVRTVRVAR